MEKIKVFLSDPQVLFREGIHFTLSGEDDFEVIGESTGGDEAYSFIESNPPNIVVLNTRGDKEDGCQITRKIKRNFPTVSVMLVTDKDSEEEQFNAIKCGASACMDKDSDPDYLLDTIRVIAQGGHPLIEKMMEPNMASRVLAEFDRLAPLGDQIDNIMAKLSPRETEILNLIVAGNGMEQLLTRLNASEAVIRRQLRLIANKLVANEQAKAIIEAVQHSLPSLITSAAFGFKAEDYVTKQEFNEFKDSLIQSLRFLTGELA